MSNLTKELCYSACFYLDSVICQGLYNGMVQGISKEDNGLYILKREKVVAVASVQKEGVYTILWHQRLGHASIIAMQHLPDLKNKVNLDMQKDYHIFPLAKQSILKFPISISKSSSIFQLVHIDVWGPYSTTTYDRKY